MSGARAVIESLYCENVEVIFGYPGGTVLPLYDELYDANIRHILVRHEQAAAQCSGWVCKSHRKSGCMSCHLRTWGYKPCHRYCNCIYGFCAHDSNYRPGAAIAYSVYDAFQEANITGITLPITKHNYLVQDAKDIPNIFKEAFYIAQTGRQGPVLIGYTQG